MQNERTFTSRSSDSTEPTVRVDRTSPFTPLTPRVRRARRSVGFRRRGLWLALGALLAALTLQAGATPMHDGDDAAASQQLTELPPEGERRPTLDAALLRPDVITRALRSLSGVQGLEVDSPVSTPVRSLVDVRPASLRTTQVRGVSGERAQEAAFPLQHSGNLLRIELPAPGLSN